MKKDYLEMLEEFTLMSDVFSYFVFEEQEVGLELLKPFAFLQKDLTKVSENSPTSI